MHSDQYVFCCLVTGFLMFVISWIAFCFGAGPLGALFGWIPAAIIGAISAVLAPLIWLAIAVIVFALVSNSEN